MALPARITSGLVAALQGRLMVTVVTHFNHAREITDATEVACRTMRQAGFVLLNQSVLLKGVNDSVEALAAHLHEQGVTLLGVDNLPGSAHLETWEMPRSVCFLFGQEGPGLSEEARERCDGTFSIAQFGSTRSINAGVASGIAMHTWIRQHAF